MLGFRKLILSDKMRLFMMGVFLIVFMFFGIKMMIEESDISVKILYLGIILFFSFFFVLSELLRFIYQKTIKLLIVDCDPALAYESAQKLEKLDFIKGYKNHLLVLYTLIYLDQGEDEKLDAHLRHEAFQKSPSLKLVYNYNKFYLALHQNDLDSATDYFKLIQDVYKTKTKKRYAAKPVYSLSLISADYYYAKGNLSKAHDFLRNVVPETLNRREQTYYYISFAKYYKAKENQKAILSYQEAFQIGPNLAHVKNYK